MRHQHQIPSDPHCRNIIALHPLPQPHEDGPLYHPVVVILSCGSPAVLRFWRKAAEGESSGCDICLTICTPTARQLSRSTPWCRIL